MTTPTIETDLYYAERLPSSVNGNPRFRLATADGPFVTQSDAACSYDVENITRAIPYRGSVRVRLSLTRAGRVWNIEPLDAPSGHESDPKEVLPCSAR